VVVRAASSTLLSGTVPISGIHRNCVGVTILTRVAAVGFPEAVRRAPRRRAAFFDSYVSTLIERDVLEMELLSTVFLIKSIPAWSSGHTGRQTLSFGGKIKAIPVDALWILAP
jgi:hypothetical protein